MRELLDDEDYNVFSLDLLTQRYSCYYAAATIRRPLGLVFFRL